MKLLHRFFLSLALLSLPALCADVSVLSGGAVEPGLAAFASLVRRELGHDLKIRFNTAPQIAKRLAAGETYDILVSPPAVLDQAANDGRIVADSRVHVGRVGVGIVVRDGAPLPAADSVESLQRTLAAADSVVYNAASTGLYLDQLFARLGILETLKAKSTRYPDGASVMEHVIRGHGNEIGFGAITEIGLYAGKGLTYAGPLPAAVQNYTRYDAAIMPHAPEPQAAAAVLQLLQTPAARAAFAGSGIE